MLDLDTWVAEEIERIRRFRDWYLTQHQQNPDQVWPLTNLPGDWDEQYRIFSDENGPG